MDAPPLSKTMELAMPLPSSPNTHIHVRLDVQTKAIMVFLTTAMIDDTQKAPIGSFVYAIPNAHNPAEPLSTPLLAEEPTIDLTTRAARLLARKLKVPVHVSSSMSFTSAIMGGSVEEEMAAFRKVIDVVVARVQEAQAELGVVV